jgi:hypothetical protein
MLRGTWTLLALRTRRGARGPGAFRFWQRSPHSLGRASLSRCARFQRNRVVRHHSTTFAFVYRDALGVVARLLNLQLWLCPEIFRWGVPQCRQRHKFLARCPKRSPLYRTNRREKAELLVGDFPNRRLKVWAASRRCQLELAKNTRRRVAGSPSSFRWLMPDER